MGLKRIMFMAEATYPADDARTFEELKAGTAMAVAGGVDAIGGNVARVAITGAFTDPDPEISLPDPPDGV